MSVRIQIAGVTVKGNFLICHHFTLAYLSAKRAAPSMKKIHAAMAAHAKGYGPALKWALSKKMSRPARQNGELMTFQGDVICFFDPGPDNIRQKNLQHSMVAYLKSVWAGVNNIGTFGLAVGDPGLARAWHMNQRIYAGVGSVGWEGNGNLWRNAYNNIQEVLCYSI